jgi:hypothetical protein
MIVPEDPQTTSILEIGTFDRRRVISGLGMAGLGILATSTHAGAAPFQKSRSNGPNVSVQTQPRTPARQQPQQQQQQVNYTDLPSDWVRKQGWLLPEYNRYLCGLKLRTISPQQVIGAHAKCKGSVWNSLPPKSWWTRMGYTLRVADRVALEMNLHEAEVVSGYRNPSYNALCAGAKSGSWHQANVALDVKFPARASKVTATARNLRDRGLFKGGVGGYWNFTHIDTRGQNVNW